MKISGWKKIALGALGTILLGALGSGLWDAALKPGGQWIGRSILTAATFGSSVVKDAVYREAAKGLHEGSALASYGLLIVYLCGVCGAFTGLIHGKLRSKVDEMLDETDPVVLKQKIISLKRRRAILEKQFRVVGITTVVSLLLILGIEFTSYLKLVQANLAYTFFAQSMKICRPYIDDHQAQTIESRFASIHGRSDYIAVTNDIRHIADMNRRKLPEYTPW
jgi:hypothetical protein